MKKIKKEDKKISEKNYQFINLILRFMLTLIILVLVFVVYQFFTQKFEPTNLTTLQYHYYKEAEDQAPKVLEGKDLEYAENLAKCPPGYCAINNTSGIKRCPDGDHQLVYYQLEESCTRKFFCDYEPLSYAVNTDGSTNKKGICEKNVPCRCSKGKNCKSSIVSTFEIEFSSDPNDPDKNNFVIGQNNYDINQYGYTPISISNPSVEFCEINPGFTQKVEFGCDFRNSINDKLGCQFIDSIQQISESPENLIISALLRSKIIVGSGNFDSYLFNLTGVKDYLAGADNSNQFYYPVGQGSQNGFLQFSRKDNSLIEYVSYSNFRVTTYSNQLIIGEIIHLQTVKNDTVFNDPKHPYGSKGFANEWSPENCIIKKYEINSVRCIDRSDGPNYKNMLICTQDRNQVCKQGIFSYNFDKLNISGLNTDPELLTQENFTRNFCQNRISSGNDIKINNNYLTDPAYYTMSCHFGTGCGDVSYSSSTKDGLEAAAGKYFPDVDVGGINGPWSIVTTTYPQYTPLDNDDKFLLNKESMDPGDFWAIKSVPETLVTGTSTPVNGSSIFVTGLLELSIYIGQGSISPSVAPVLSFIEKDQTSGTSVKIDSCEYTSQFGQVINITTPLTYGLSSNQPVEVLPFGYSYDTYGTLVKQNLGNKNTPNVFFQPESDIFTIDQANANNPSPRTLEIYKQFSFSGPNYNTIIGFDSNSNQFRRYYAGASGSRLEYSDGSTIYPPQNTDILFLTNRGMAPYTEMGTSAFLNIQDSKSSFKIPMSMYYPVWNPATYQQECIRCKPSLIAYPELGLSDNIDNVVIQYSGKDFGNYEYNKKLNKFSYTSISELFPNTQRNENTTRTLYLSEPNLDIEIGDFIMDSCLNLPIEIFYDKGLDGSNDDITKMNSNLIVKNKLFFTQSVKYSYGIEESQYSNIVIDDKELVSSANLTINISDQNNLKIKFINKDIISDINSYENYFFGKLYQSTTIQNTSNNSNGFYIIPTVKITKLSKDRKVVETDAPLTYKLGTKNKHYIQFCRLSEDKQLELNLSNSITNNITTGTCASIEVSRISEGRITNINVISGGKDFLEDLIPTITIGNYF